MLVVMLVILSSVSTGIMSSVRAYVGGESLWSKAQKESVVALNRYATTHVPVEFERYAAAARGDGRAADGRITILVSHRFSTVRMADLIVVLDGARAVEVGTHEQLMARGGQYAQLYGIQAAAYR